MTRCFLFLCLLVLYSPLLSKEENRLYISGFDSTYLTKTTPVLPKPLMWTARLKVDRALSGGYEHQIYNLNEYFQLYLGGSFAYLQTRNSKPDEMFGLSGYLLARIYILKKHGTEVFILYSPAGPSILSQNTFSTTKWSNQFVFQNQIGIGVSLSRFKEVEVTLRQYHFSNGSLFAVNGGVDIPLSLGLAVKF